MHKDQQFSPKYWVMYDKRTDDVYISTAHKSRDSSIDIFLDKYSYSRYGVMTDEEVFDMFEEDEDLECILIKINKLSKLYASNLIQNML